jgi:hypothetical protein
MSTAELDTLAARTRIPNAGLRKLAIISFDYAADGTVTARCQGVRGVGPTDVDAVLDMDRQLKQVRPRLR